MIDRWPDVTPQMTHEGSRGSARDLQLVQMDQSAELRMKPRGVLPYMGYIGMCGPKGYGFSAVLVINRARVWPFWP